MIQIIGDNSLSDSSGLSYGAYRSKVKAGSGNDTLFIQSVSLDPQGGYGAFESEIFGGGGNDLIIVDAITGDRGEVNGVNSFDIRDSLVHAGSGNDIVSVGIGSATVNGGSGTDTAILEYLDTNTMTVSALSNGVRVTGTENLAGGAFGWAQNLVNIEEFQVNNTIYSASALVSEFG